MTIDNCSSQWVYQALPSYHDVQDIKFFDANTGIMILYSYDPGMLRTTNGGFNWTTVNNSVYYYDMQIIDSTTMYLVGVRSSAFRILRTFNRGLTWDSISFTSSGGYTGLSFVNRDTGWISGANNLSYECIWKTTNGGITLIQQTDTTGVGKIFFLKNKINGEYYGWHYSSTGDDKFWKTTNSGNNWFQVIKPQQQYLGHFAFIDENTGWFTWSFNGVSGGIYKTTNGGINWFNQIIPSGNGIHNSFTVFKVINYDTIYGGGGYIDLGSRVSGLIWKTTNGGINWGFQKPDTNFYNGFYGAIDFINSKTGWAYEGNGIHTTNGGGPIIYTDIMNNHKIILFDYKLYQNYPNPFNPFTTIEFSIPQDSYVKLIIFDITGKAVFKVIYNFYLKMGNYKYKIDAFNTLGLSSGIYFYRFEARSIYKNQEIFTQTKKMIYLK